MLLIVNEIMLEKLFVWLILTSSFLVHCCWAMLWLSKTTSFLCFGTYLCLLYVQAVSYLCFHTMNMIPCLSTWTFLINYTQVSHSHRDYLGISVLDSGFTRSVLTHLRIWGMINYNCHIKSKKSYLYIIEVYFNC